MFRNLAFPLFALDFALMSMVCAHQSVGGSIRTGGVGWALILVATVGRDQLSVMVQGTDCSLNISKGFPGFIGD